MVNPDVGRRAADGSCVPHAWLVAAEDDPHPHTTCYETSLNLFMIVGQEEYTTDQLVSAPSYTSYFI